MLLKRGRERLKKERIQWLMISNCLNGLLKITSESIVQRTILNEKF